MPRPAALGPSALALLALLSGGSALGYEVLFVRALTTVLGDMFYVHAALLAAFLVGIGSGARFAHRFARWLFACEMAVGAYALALPGLLDLVERQPSLANVAASPALTVAATVGFVALPSFALGFSIPLFSATVRARRPERPAFGAIYAAYNLGALVAILAVEFALVRSLGVSASIRALGVVNLAIGALLLASERARAPVMGTPRDFPERTIAALSIASFASALFQLFALKFSYLVFHPHRENFALVLAVNLLGIWLGARIVGRWQVRATTLLVVAALAIGGAFVAYLPLLHAYQATAGWAKGAEWWLVAHKFAFLCVFALAPMVAFGGLVPAWMRGEEEVANESGRLLFASSCANALGYLVYVFVAHSALDSDVLLCAVGALALLSALVDGGSLAPRARTVGLVALGLLVALPFAWRERDLHLAQFQQLLEDEQDVTVFKSGGESATLLEAPDWTLITYNGHPSVHVEELGRVAPAELASGVIPALAAPRLDDALVLGLGTGVTAGATARIFEHTDVVEINPAFFAMLPSLAFAHHDLANNPAATLHLADARSFLIGRENRYDAIVNSIPAPTYYSASKIYTEEFYRRVRRALRPDGVFSTWIGVANLTERGIHTMLTAIRSQFAHCDLRLLRHSYYMATCSNAPLRTRAFSDLPVAPELLRTLTHSLAPFDLGESFEDDRIAHDLFAHYEPPPGPANTDDHPVLEFLVVRDTQLGEIGEEPFLTSQATFGIDVVREAATPDAARLARRAAFFSARAPLHFQRSFVPLLERRADVAREFEALR